MKFVSLSKNKYKEVLEIFKLISSKKPWLSFISEDLFVIKLSNKKDKYICSFNGNEDDGVFGISFFIGDDGFNSLHDLYSIKNEDSINLYDFTSTNIRVCNNDELTIDEIEFFKKNKVRIKSKSNVVVNNYTQGYVSRIATTKEANSIIKCLQIISSVIGQDKDILIDGFKNNKVAYIEVDDELCEYSLDLIPIPFLEQDYKYKKTNEEEIEEFNNLAITDEEFFLLTKNIAKPILTNDCNIGVVPLYIVYANKLDGLLNSELIICEPKDYRLYLINIIKEFFSEYGLPKSLVINHRKLYFELKDLLNKIGVELKFVRENADFDFFLNSVAKATTSFFSLGIGNVDFSEQDDKMVRDIFSFLSTVIKNKGEMPDFLTDDDNFKIDLFNEIVDNVEDLVDEFDEMDDFIFDESEDTFVS